MYIGKFPFMKYLLIYLALFGLLFSGIDNAFAQTVHIEDHSHFHPVLQKIDELSETGQITKEDAILQKFYTGYRLEKLHGDLAELNTAPVKCMVPVIMEYYSIKEDLSGAVISEIESMIAKPETSQSSEFVSQSGNFIFYYKTSGNNAVPAEDSNGSGVPDYVEKAAFAADSSYRYQVEELGFTDFRLTDPYEVYFNNFGFYGTTTVSGGTTYITVHNNFNGFPPNTHPEGHQTGALYVTIAHEVKHAIQYAANKWAGSAGSFNWSEMDATLMEEVVFDDVNDYYNYIKSGFESFDPNSNSIFGSPQTATPGAYWHITWKLYFVEQFGMQFWVDVWKNVVENSSINFFEAIEYELSALGTNLSEQHLKNHLWHAIAGEFSTNDFGFEEREFYPNANLITTFEELPDSLFSERTVAARAANYMKVLPPVNEIGQATVIIEHSEPNLGIGTLAVFKNGTTDYRLDFSTLNTNSTEILTGWSWENIERLHIAVVNTSLNQSAQYKLFVESRDFSPKDSTELARQFDLKQNYPNPFNPATTIEFELYEPSKVTLNVYDSMGRLVRTIVDQDLPPANHQFTFEATGLSSGIYFYRLTTPARQETQKMMLIK